MEPTENITNEKTYDAVFWTGIVRITRFLIPLINEAFGTQYGEDTTVTLESAKEVLKHTDSSLSKREVDTVAKVTDQAQSTPPKYYHFECETWADESFAVRIAEYASAYAFQSVTPTPNGAEMVIPHSAVIFLRNGAAFADQFTITVQYPGGTIQYDAPILRMHNYTIEEIFEKRLFLLLPFYGFLFDDQFAHMEESGADMDVLRTELDFINENLTALVMVHDLAASEKRYILDLMKRVFEKLTTKYETVQKGVDEIMGGYILNTETDNILQQGLRQGIQQGLSQGIQQGLSQGLQEGKIQEFILLRREDGYSEDQILTGAMERFQISRTEAEKYANQSLTLV